MFDGGDVIVISNSGGNSAIDTEQGYTYNGGRILAIMPRGGMSSESMHCKNFSSVAINQSISLKANEIYSVTADGKKQFCFRSPISINGIAIYIGSNSAKISTDSDSSIQLDENGMCRY